MNLNQPTPEPSSTDDALRKPARRIAHDLNNTLGTLIGNLELLRMDLEPNHPATESALEIKRAIDRGRTLVQELFTLTGPPPAKSVAASADTIASGPPAELPRGNGQHILYLDDEEPLVFLATNLFKRLGYRVSGFTDAQTACDAFARNPDQFDLVVTDHNLRSASGIQVAGRMLELRPKIPIVLATGELTDALAEQAKDIGIRHLLYKPNTVDALCHAVHELARRP